MTYAARDARDAIPRVMREKGQSKNEIFWPVCDRYSEALSAVDNFTKLRQAADGAQNTIQKAVS